MKQREWLLVILLVVFGLVYQVFESGGCSLSRSDIPFIDGSNLASEIYHDFPGGEKSLLGLTGIMVKNPAGSIKVNGNGSNEAVLRVVYRVHHPDREKAGEIAAGIQDGFERSGDQLVLRPNAGDADFPLDRVRVLLELEVPDKCSLDLNNQFGVVEVDSVSAPLIIGNRHGSTKVEKTAAKLKLRHGHGQLHLNEVNGPVEADVQHSRVVIQNITSLTAKGAYSDFQVKNSAGPVAIEASFGKLKLEDCRSLEIDSRHTSINVANVAAGISIKASYAPLRLERINGDTIITGRNCPISINQIQADYLLIKNSYDRVEVNGFRGHQADIDLRHGRLSFSLLELGGRLNVNALHTGITIEYPAGLEPSFNLRARQGRIVNRGSAVLEILEDRTEQSAFLQAGSPEIVINASYGSIVLRNNRS